MSENDKLPYFELVLPPEQDGGEWITIGALWKLKSGKPGYSGMLQEGVTVDTSNMKVYVKPQSTPAQEPQD